MSAWSNGLADTMQSEKILEAWHLVNKGSARVIHISCFFNMIPPLVVFEEQRLQAKLLGLFPEACPHMYPGHINILFEFFPVHSCGNDTALLES